jgi:phosphoglycerol geranylgeranyltransferase
MSVYKHLMECRSRQKAGYLVLIDPDARPLDETAEFARVISRSGVDAILYGGSLITDDGFTEKLKAVREASDIPVILFPGSVGQVSSHVDAILYISVISGRNPNFLIGDHVTSAIQIKRSGVETIATGYMLVESGKVTTAEFISGTRPLPAHKPELALAHALAGEMLGLKMLYLEAGSGAERPVPNEMISVIKKYVRIPVIVGGGIKTPETAREKVLAGADFIVTGNVLEDGENLDLLEDFVKTVHGEI